MLDMMSNENNQFIQGQFGKYKNLGKLAQGGMGTIFKVKVLSFDREEQKIQNQVKQMKGPSIGDTIIIKFVKKKEGMNTQELQILKHIKKNPMKTNRFANLYDYWEQPEQPRPSENRSQVRHINEGGFMCFAMEMFGCSIWDLVNDRQNCPDKKFSLRCTLQLGIELTKCIRDLHKMGFIHLDIKPDNVVVSKDQGQKLYLIDYGISEEYLKEGVHRQQEDVQFFCGNLVYISKNAFEYKNQSRRDDLISMMYMLIYTMTKYLPWHNPNFDIRSHKSEVTYLKLSSLAEEVCTGEAAVLVNILLKFYNMQYTEEPDYQYIIFMFEKILLDLDHAPSSKNYDWTQNYNRNSVQRLMSLSSQQRLSISEESINCDQFLNVSEEPRKFEPESYNFAGLQNLSRMALDRQIKEEQKNQQ